MGKVLILEATINLFFNTFGDGIVNDIMSNSTVKETEGGVKYVLLNEGYEIKISK